MTHFRFLCFAGLLLTGINVPAGAQWQVRSGGNSLHNGFLDVVGPDVPQLRWQRSMPGVFGQPVFVDGDVVVTTWLQPGTPAAEGTIVAMRLQTGDTLWTRSLPTDFPTDWSVYACAMRNGRVYATRAGNSNSSYLYALDTANGSILWRSQDLISIYVTEGPVFAPNGDVLVGNLNNVLRIQGASGTRVYQVPRGGGISGGGEPLVHDGKYYIRGGVVGDRLAAYDLEDGQFLYWSGSMGGWQTGLFAGRDGTFYFPVSNVFALRDTTGGFAPLWSSPLPEQTAFSTFAVGPDSTVYVYGMVGDSMVVNRLDHRTGAVLNRSRPIKGGGSIFSGHMAIDRNGTLFVTNSESYLYCFKADLSLRWIDIVPRSEGGPALAGDGTLLVSGQDGIRAYWGGLLSAPDDADGGLPSNWSLEQNYPNPFNPAATIRYRLPHASFVTLTVYDMIGQQVAQPVNEQQQAGYHEVAFRGDELASGVYFYRLKAGDFVQTKRMLILK